MRTENPLHTALISFRLLFVIWVVRSGVVYPSTLAQRSLQIVTHIHIVFLKITTRENAVCPIESLVLCDIYINVIDNNLAM